MEENKYVGLFKDETELINKEISEIDSLYEEVKTHYDALKNSFAKGSLSFIEKQTSNLVSLKTAKSSLIKDRITIKKLCADFELKDIKANGDSNDTSGLAQQIAKEILNAKEDSVVENFVQHANEIDEDPLERRIRELEESGSIKYSDNEERLKFENRQIKLIIVKKGDKWKFVALDGNNKQVKDYPVPKNTDKDIVFKTNTNGTIEAVDENGVYYKVKVIQ